MGLLLNTKTCVILITLLIVNTNGIENIDEVKKQKIDDFINSLLFSCDRNNFAGANLALIYQGQVVYTTGYGVRHLRKKNINFFFQEGDHYCPPTKLREDNVFTRVCLSVYRGCPCDYKGSLHMHMGHPQSY